MASTQHSQRRGRGAQHLDAVVVGRAAAEADRLGVNRVLMRAGHNQRHQATKRRHMQVFARFDLFGDEAFAHAGLHRLHHRMVGLVGLHQNPTGPFAAARAPGDLL